MRVVKSLRIGLLQKGFQNDGESFWAFSLLLPFRLDTGEIRTEKELWEAVGEDLPAEALDFGMPKQRGEFLVYGVACPPEPTSGCRVSARVGELKRSLYVAGDRYWRDGKATDAVAFESMPLTWENAFGGEDFPANPLGKGYVEKSREGDFRALPNVEDPDHLLRSPSMHPAPASFRGIPFANVERMKLLGTFDEAWQKTRFPGFAADMDWGYFNVAPSPGQILPEGYFRGDETFSFEYLCPGTPLLEGKLPSVATRCFIQRQGQTALDDLKTRLDTVLMFPHRCLGVLVFRAATQVKEDDAADVESVMLAAELLTAQKSTAHYAQVYQKRSDPERGHLAVLQESDLMPSGLPADAFESAEPREEFRLKAGRVRAEQELARVRDLLVQAGQDPNLVPDLPPEPVIESDPEKMPEQIKILQETFEAKRAEAEAKRAEAEAELRRVCEQHGKSYEELTQGANRSGGPPKVEEQLSLERVRAQVEQASAQGADVSHLEAQLADPAFAKRIEDAQGKLLSAYHQNAHLMPEAPLLAEQAAHELGQALIQAARAGETLERLDFTRADLRDADLSGLDLSGVFLEAAQLCGAKLHKTKLCGAVLARADLTGAELCGADLSACNLGAAKLENTDLEGANLTQAVLMRINVSSSSFKQALLPDAMFLEASLKQVSFDSADLSGSFWLQLDLTGSSFANAKLQRASFVEVTGSGVCFDGAQAERATFVETALPKSSWQGALLTRVALALGCDLSGADLRKASAVGACFRGSVLKDANFAEADLRQADLSNADARGAKLYRMDLRRASLSRADLRGAILASTNAMEAVLDHANLRGADLRGANLFRSDLSKVLLDKQTLLTDALLEGARIVHRSEDD